MELTISDADIIVLRKTLEKAIYELDWERAFTPNPDVRVDLGKHEESLKAVLAQIPNVKNIAA